jgi:hypothetical protein
MESMKKERNMKKLKWIIGLAALPVFLVLAGFFLRAQECVTTPVTGVVGYTGGDPSTIYSMDGIDNDAQQGYLRLHYLGANFEPSNDYSNSTNHRKTAAAADFNGDGYVDLVEGGEGCDTIYYKAGASNLAIFISRGKDPINPLKFKFDPPAGIPPLGAYYIDYVQHTTPSLKTWEMWALGAGDFDGDGDNDIAAVSYSGKLWIFWNKYVEHNDAPGGLPDFDPTPTLVMDIVGDGCSESDISKPDSTYDRWDSNIAVADIDGDHDPDLIVGIANSAGDRTINKYGEVVILVNDGHGVFSRKVTLINPYPSKISGKDSPKGVTAVAVGRFRGADVPVDFIVGHVGYRDVITDERRLYYYKNDGLGNFTQDLTRTLYIPEFHGTASFLGAADLDMDGYADLIVSTDGTHQGGSRKPWLGGYVFWYKNDGTGHFTVNPAPSDGSRTSSSGDLDGGTFGDFDKDGDIDFFVCDGNDSKSVYFFMNEALPLYVPFGRVESKNRVPCDFIISDNAITAATITVSEEKPLKTDILYYLSNSDDEYGDPKWEGPVTPGTEWEFESPGNFLRWRADFSSTDEHVTPKLLSLNMAYKYISKREYSRTSQAFTTAEVNSSHAGDEDVLYAASFEFPKWKGHLRSWDVTNLTLAQTRNSQLADILDVGATFVEDAGEILKTRIYSTRLVYTAYAADADGIMNDRTDFSVSNKDRLDDYLDLGLGSPEIEPLIRFVLGDPTVNTRNWKLGDINHSSPRALNPPNGNPALMGAGYSQFVEDNASRPKVVLVGANDGMLHCFDAATMEELWAFIPNNLLYKLKRMRVTDRDCGIFLQHLFFVDGTPAIQDVYFAGAWHTVLICGQGPGWGKNNKCYYFALDVTNPLSPQPLWEFTHDTMGETWSVPVIGHVESESKWIAFFGSGYDNDPDDIVGNYFYAVDAQTGSLIRAFAMVKGGEPASPFGIQNTLPGSPSEVDSDRDGYIDAVYIGDLIGRLWKLEVSPKAADKWDPRVLYSDPFQQPIITKPEIGIDAMNNTVRVYFGTGGDEKATNTAYYSLIALKDASSATVEWYMGNQTLGDALHLDASLKKSDLAPGEKIWADPIISNTLVYVATLYGSIESLNPCLTLPGVGKIYSRYISSAQAGTSALLGSEGEVVAFLQTKQKVRSAVTVGNIQSVGVGSDAIKVSKVFTQSYTRPEASPPEPPSQVLAQPVNLMRLVIKSWREVYKIIR